MSWEVFWSKDTEVPAWASLTHCVAGSQGPSPDKERGQSALPPPEGASQRHSDQVSFRAWKQRAPTAGHTLAQQMAPGNQASSSVQLIHNHLIWLLRRSCGNRLPTEMCKGQISRPAWKKPISWKGPHAAFGPHRAAPGFGLEGRGQGVFEAPIGALRYHLSSGKTWRTC